MQTLGRTLAYAFDVGNDPVIIGTCADASAIFTNSGAVKIYRGAAIWAMLIINNFFFRGKFSERTDESPVISHEKLAVSVTANYISGFVIGDVIGYAGKDFHRYNVIFCIVGAADYSCVKNRNPLHMVCLTAVFVTFDLPFGFCIKFFRKTGTYRQKVFCAPGVLGPYVKIGSIAEEFGFIKTGVALFKRSNIVDKRRGVLCRNVNASFSGGNVPSDGIPADNSADDYKNDDKSYNNFKKADFVIGRIGIWRWRY